jgi:multidrug resistance efflux pump
MRGEQEAADRVGQTRVAESRAQASAARAEADVASTDSGLLGQLEKDGLASRADASRARGLARARRAAADAQLLGSERATRERDERNYQSRTRYAELERDRGQRQSEADVLERELDQLDWEISEHTVRATIDAKVGELTPLRPGSVVAAGDKLLTLVPNGELKVVAGYTRDVVGRIRVGQTARVRLSSFSWMQYGSLSARVARVGTEPLNGYVQVELLLSGAEPRSIPLQHGLAGNVDVEVERATPATLVLRTLGRAVSAESPPPVAQEKP